MYGLGLCRSWSVPLAASADSADLIAIAPHLPSMLSRLTRPGPRAGRVPLVQTVSAVERTAKVASTTKIANHTTRPITLTSATVPRPMTSVLILTIW